MFSRFSIQLKWYDDRIQFENLKTTEKKIGTVPIKRNIVDDEKRQDIWIPKLRFGNSHTDVTIENDEFASVTISLEGNPILNSMSNLKENQLYKGSENPFVYERVYDLQLYCEFQLASYPFDTQTCSIKVIFRIMSANIVCG
jgi:hypothetical protein